MAFPMSAQLLDACVLAIASGGDTYGYELTQQIKRGFEVSESTLYPVLRRLLNGALLDVYDQPFQGRNRRYYRITPMGQERLKEYQMEWAAFRTAIDAILLGGDEV